MSIKADQEHCNVCGCQWDRHLVLHSQGVRVTLECPSLLPIDKKDPIRTAFEQDYPKSQYQNDRVRWYAYQLGWLASRLSALADKDR